jgi:hypothetical protein
VNDILARRLGARDQGVVCQHEAPQRKCTLRLATCGPCLCLRLMYVYNQALSGREFMHMSLLTTYNVGNAGLQRGTKAVWFPRHSVINALYVIRHSYFTNK